MHKPSAAYQHMAKPRALPCLALGCTRKTRNRHGFCFQHADMVRAIKERADKERAARAALKGKG